MVEVFVESIRVSLISQQRVVILREVDGNTQIPIWIGPYESEAISVKMEATQLARPMTHDLLKNSIEKLGGSVTHIVVSDLRNSIYYGEIHIDLGGKTHVIDARPSDAIALGVRCDIPLYVSDIVLNAAGIEPESDIRKNDDEDDTENEEMDLDAFRDFFDGFDEE